MRDKVMLICIAIGVLLVVAFFSLPFFGQLVPEARFTMARNSAAQIRNDLRLYEEAHPGDMPPSLGELARNFPSLRRFLSFDRPNPPHDSIHFINVYDETDGIVVYAASSPIEDPSSTKIVRIVAMSEERSFEMAEERFQDLLMSKLEIDGTQQD